MKGEWHKPTQKKWMATTHLGVMSETCKYMEGPQYMHCMPYLVASVGRNKRQKGPSNG